MGGSRVWGYGKEQQTHTVGTATITAGHPRTDDARPSGVDMSLGSGVPLWGVLEDGGLGVAGLASTFSSWAPSGVDPTCCSMELSSMLRA